MQGKRWYFLGFSVLVLGLIGANWRQGFFWAITPTLEFNLAESPPEPNYQDLRFWAMHPSKKDEDRSASLGHTQVFFLHPTSLRSRFAWNEELGTQAATDRFKWTKEQQAAVFAECCEVFAPHYRQATLGAYFSIENGFKARNLAYTDVLRAFDAFISRDNQGRPFILAGHSQGSEHGIRLIHDRILGTPLHKRMIAAYLPGFPMPRSLLQETHSGLPICESAQATGCLIAWGSYAEYADLKKVSLPVTTWAYPDGLRLVDAKDFVCVNPISWTTDAVIADRKLHLGLHPQKSVARFTSARCEQNVVLLDNLDSELQFNFKGNYHLYDYNLFFYNIRQNLAERIAAFSERAL